MVAFKIMTDSTADVPLEWIEQYGLTIMGLTVELDGVVYETVGENRLTSDVLLEKMLAGGQPTTSQVNVGQFEAVFAEAAKAGEAVLYLAFSAALSGTYQSAVMARDMVLEAYPTAVIEIINTKAATIGEGYLVLKAAQAREAGSSLAETVALIEDLAPRLRTYLLVDDLQHLVRGGRLSKAAALIGGLVNIKPLLSIDAEGSLVPIAKLRGKKKGIKEMLSLTLQQLDDPCVMVAYTGDVETAEQLKTTLLAESQVEQVILEPLGPIIASHTGTGAIAILSISKDKR
ncbi:DegV family EDD domain-containing protein [Streptococcus sp. zg-86]|uniref:DegV family EDD domain-containing protein n=1 Tax=Streptococcus zhangguiae TaxID=2664091 RepID=A0A6I4RKA1_9STRE|nr:MULTISPECIES: DegV family protein [unclassified Streptococcus]MTB65063.1 DegV family EDD domain-containing protein [Streptococcus sp. zg-86]MTB91250.1 DegV family EDD domain-containing protein [Streptococcus sp. zg-36]MWV57023.1 DegV family EDD domain-containing protein [Streptococcus sp. zg-70]QTH47555.1 DegV family protein [Streptococcus sp. zg-86]